MVMKVISDIVRWVEGNSVGEGMIGVKIVRMVNEGISRGGCLVIDGRGSKML